MASACTFPPTGLSLGVDPSAAFSAIGNRGILEGEGAGEEAGHYPPNLEKRKRKQQCYGNYICMTKRERKKLSLCHIP